MEEELSDQEEGAGSSEPAPWYPSNIVQEAMLTQINQLLLGSYLTILILKKQQKEIHVFVLRSNESMFIFQVYLRQLPDDATGYRMPVKKYKCISSSPGFKRHSKEIIIHEHLPTKQSMSSLTINNPNLKQIGIILSSN